MDTLEVDWAWAAGLFEGEGCAAICRNKDRYLARLYLNMTDEDVMFKFYRIVGTGILYEPTVVNRARENRKPTWRWTCNKKAEVAATMDRLEPYMCSRRRAKFVELRDLWNK